MRNLETRKDHAYVWKVRNSGKIRDHGWIDGWSVVDADNGDILAGGLNHGNNIRSGRALINRKRDAQAFVDGYNAAFTDDGEVDPRFLTEKPDGSPGIDRNAVLHFTSEIAAKMIAADGRMGYRKWFGHGIRRAVSDEVDRRLSGTVESPGM